MFNIVYYLCKVRYADVVVRVAHVEGVVDHLVLYLRSYGYKYYLYKLVNTRSDTDFGNTQSAPRGGERERLCARPSRP